MSGMRIKGKWRYVESVSLRLSRYQLNMGICLYCSRRDASVELSGRGLNLSIILSSAERWLGMKIGTIRVIRKWVILNKW